MWFEFCGQSYDYYERGDKSGKRESEKKVTNRTNCLVLMMMVVMKMMWSNLTMRMRMSVLMRQVAVWNLNSRGIVYRTRRRDVIQEFRIIKWSRVFHTIISIEWISQPAIEESTHTTNHTKPTPLSLPLLLVLQQQHKRLNSSYNKF